jgi:uncharacterized protein (DUF58 family)
MSVLASVAPRLFPRERLRQWFLERVRRRRGPAALPFRLQHRNIFVVPTGFGLAFGSMLAFMAIGGLNFNNNMALLLVFILASIAQLTTVLAYRNLVGLHLDSIHADPVFCGDPAVFRVYLSNPEDRPRFAIQAGILASSDCRDVATRATGILRLGQPTAHRGWLKMDTFRLETRYPLGLFRAWSWFFPETRCLVYPAPSQNPPPLPRLGSGHGGQAVKGEGEQVHGLREYRFGDSLRRVAWRTSARHELLYTREMETPREEACELSWDLLPGIAPETRLSILTAWVLLADHRQVSYSLQLPGAAIPAGLGLEHRSRCLEALALHGQ